MIKIICLNVLSKGISTPIVLTIIIVLAVVLAGGVFTYQHYYLPKQETEAPKVETPKDKTADWKIYRNEEYGFEVKYPKELPIEQGGPLVKPNIFYFGGPPYETVISLVVSNTEETELFSSPEQTEVTEITIDNEKGVRYEKEWEVPAGFARGAPVTAHTNRMISIDVQHSGKNYRFHLTNSTDFQDIFKTFDQILSTFRFID